MEVWNIVFLKIVTVTHAEMISYSLLSNYSIWCEVELLYRCLCCGWLYDFICEDFGRSLKKFISCWFNYVTECSQVLYLSPSQGEEDTCHVVGTFGVLKEDAWWRQYLLVLRLDSGSPPSVWENCGDPGIGLHWAQSRGGHCQWLDCSFREV